MVSLLPSSTMSVPIIINKPAPGVPFFSPAQDPPSGTPVDPQPNDKPIPKLFTPIKIRDVTFQNRIFVSIPFDLTMGLVLMFDDTIGATALPIFCRERLCQTMANGS